MTEVSGGKRHTWLLRVVREWQGTGEASPGDVLYRGPYRFVYTLTAGTKRIQDCQMSLKVSRCGLPSKKGKGLPQQAEVAQGVPGRLRPRIFLTFGTTRAVGRQPYAPAAFTAGEIPGTYF